MDQKAKSHKSGCAISHPNPISLSKLGQPMSLTLLEAPHPMQRIDVCRENMSLPAYKAANSQHEPLCVPSALTRRDTGNLLPGAATKLALRHPTNHKWPPHMFSLPGFPANMVFNGSARTSRAFCSQVVCFVPSKFSWHLNKSEHPSFPSPLLPSICQGKTKSWRFYWASICHPK